MGLLDFLRDQPALVVFFVIGAGYLLDRVRIGGMQLGATTGVLLAGLVLGHFGLRGSSGSQSVGFMLFIYCVGLRAGPQFFSAFRENGARFAALALVMALLGMATTVAVDRFLGLPPGYDAGLLAGALTSTPTLVAAQDAVRQGMATLPAGYERTAVLGNIAASYAISYVVGLFGLLILVSVLPRLMGVDLKAEAERLAAERQARGALPAPASYADLPVLRAYHAARNTTVAILQRAGCLVEGVKRGGAVLETPPETLEAGDRVSLLGSRAAHRAAQELLGPETIDAELLEVRPETRTILVTRTNAARGTTPVLEASLASACIVVRVTRAGVALPPGLDLSLANGDLVVAVGLPGKLDAFARHLGRSERPTNETDLVTFAFGMAAGILIGALTVHVAGISVGLGAAGGLLLSGLIIGYGRTLNPTFGQLPVAAAGVLMELGLQFFIANVGLEAGGWIVEALRTTGVWLPIGALAVMTGPLLLGFVVGRTILGFDPVTLLGALTGALTSTPALDLVNRRAESALPTVGYAGTYAFANVLLTIAGSLLMRF
jgi:putative transport protein